MSIKKSPKVTDIDLKEHKGKVLGFAKNSQTQQCYIKAMFIFGWIVSERVDLIFL